MGVGRSFTNEDGSRTPVNNFARPRDAHPYPSPQGGGEFCRRGTLCLNAHMPQDRLRIFISAVTSEFGKARDAVASDLRARGHEVTVQSDFKQSPDSETLLGNLSDYIRDCHAVVCIVGKRCGAGPPARAAEGVKGRLTGVLPDDIKEASYTQWEFFLARHFKRRPYLYIAGDSYKPDRDTAVGDRADLQNTYLEFLKADGAHYTGFSDANELRIAVLRDEPKIVAKPAPMSLSPAKPIVLPYQSIGDLFKGRDDFMQRLCREFDAGAWWADGHCQSGALWAWRYRQDPRGGGICLGTCRRLHGITVCRCRNAGGITAQSRGAGGHVGATTRYH